MTNFNELVVSYGNSIGNDKVEIRNLAGIISRIKSDSELKNNIQEM